MPHNIMSLAQKYLTNPERISMGETNIVAPKIKTEIMRISHEKKHDEMVRQLRDREGTVIIFVKTKYGTEKMAKKLREDGFTADCLHGDLRQRKRDQVMRAYREKKFRILCATDIAARGLDVPHIEHVINHDLPQVAEDYIHRMGRTARAGADGSALCFISPADNGKWREIEKLLGIKSNDNEGARGNHRNGKSNGKKPLEKKGRWKKTGGPDGRSFNGKKGDDRNANTSGEKKKSWGDKPRFDKSSEGGNVEKRSFVKKKPYGDKPKSADGAQKKSWGDKPKFEKRGDGGKPAQGGFKKKFAGKPNANKGKPQNGNSSNRKRSNVA
jgi:superfamily II DNA/RNA helicase